MVVAMPTPYTTPRKKKRIRLALVVAVSAASPRYLPTQTELIEPLRDCSTFTPSVGKANASRVRPMGPSVRRWERDEGDIGTFVLEVSWSWPGGLVPPVFAHARGYRAASSGCSGQTRCHPCDRTHE